MVENKLLSVPLLNISGEKTKSERLWNSLVCMESTWQSECGPSSDISLVFIPLRTNRWGQATIQLQTKAWWVKVIEKWES